MRKLILMIILLLMPVMLWAQETTDQFFQARVMEILDQTVSGGQNGNVFVQQNLRLKGLHGEFKDREIIFEGIGDIAVVSQNVYQTGDKVIVLANQNEEGDYRYFVTDYVRSSKLLWLVLLFVLVVVCVGRWKGLKAVLSLVVTFFVLMKFVLPGILSGSNPLVITLVGSFVILLVIIYVTEGFSKVAHLAILSIIFSLSITGVLSVIFSNFARLTGNAQEEIMYLMSISSHTLDFKGLLLAAIIIGTLGVLDDVVISQIVSVQQIKKANSQLSDKEVYKRAMEIGRAHLGSMVNTLFLAYAGASLPLLLLFTVNEPPFTTFTQVVNNEMIATEIVRTLVGSVGLALAIPIATYIASRFIKTKHETDKQKRLIF